MQGKLDGFSLNAYRTVFHEVQDQRFFHERQAERVFMRGKLDFFYERHTGRFFEGQAELFS
jgi:hypothetical protein